MQQQRLLLFRHRLLPLPFRQPSSKCHSAQQHPWRHHQRPQLRPLLLPLRLVVGLRLRRRWQQISLPRPLAWR